MRTMDDRENRVPRKDLDGNALSGAEFLRIRKLVAASDAHTNEEIDAVIHAELANIRESQTAGV